MKFPTYTCHKVVEAATIVDIVRGQEKYLIVKAYLTDMVQSAVQTSEPAMMEKAVIGDYYVVYDGGKYTSVSPKAVFEEGYKLDVVDEPQQWRRRHTPPEAT